MDVHRLTAEVGYWLAEPFWNRGIMTAALKAATEAMFRRHGWHRIEAAPYAYNRASMRVLEKAGYTLEGVKRCSAFKDFKVVDQALYARIGPAAGRADRAAAGESP
ncbi:MAG: GNAT family N-acetyltransferase [Planctomycetes bacterium]|jgi:ribosomal-protein-alanine N-acetyltransferase|nr:GNAT family N-acetyltransferase [Planctomycetota bacterium]